MMRRILKLAFSVALAAAAIGLPVPGAAGADSPVTVQVDGAYGGVAPQGGWAPIQVTVTNHGPDTKATLRLGVTGSQYGQSGNGNVKGQVSVGSLPGGGWYSFSGPGPAGGLAVTQQLDVVLPAGTTKHFSAYLPASPGTWMADVVGPSGKMLATGGARVTQPGSSSIAVVSDDPHALDQIGSIPDLSQTFQGQPQVIHLAPGALPDSPAALSSFGLVAVTNATTDSLTAAQRRALDDYVTQGGSVLVTGGNAWRKTQAGLPADLVAMAAGSVQSLPGLPGLASVLGKPAVAGAVDVATGTRRRGVAALSDGQTPILLDAPVGRGRALYLAVDPAAEPLASWSGTAPLLRQVVVRAAADATTMNAGNPLPSGRPVAGGGVQSQGLSVFQALSNIPSLDLPSPLLIALALIVFIVLVGPVNYFLLRRIHRPDLAGGTIPLLVVLSAGSIYGIGLKTRGTDVLADRVRLLYVQPGSNRAYVDAGTGVFAPHAGTHTVSTVNGSLVTTLSGGSELFAGGGFILPQPLSSSSSATGQLVVKDGTPPTVRMTWPNADSIQAFGEEYVETQPGALEPHLTVANGRLTGTVVNHTGTTITDAVVLSGTAYSRFGSIRPGSSVAIDIPLPAAGRANRFAGQVFTLPQQIYLHAPASCGMNASCNIPGVTFQTGRPSAAERQAQRRSDVLSGVLGQDVLNAPRPLFVGWATTPSGPVRVDGQRAQLNELDAYILQLDQLALSGDGSSLAAGSVAGRMVDMTGSPSALTPQEGQGVSLPPDGSATFEFALGTTAWQRLSLGVTLPASTGGPQFGGFATTSVYNFRTSGWDPLTLSLSQATDIPAPGDHVSSEGLLRVRAQTTTSPAQLGTIDVSGERAPAA